MLQVQHERDGVALPYHWGWWHLAAVMDVAEKQHIRGRLRRTGEAVVQRYATRIDASDGEVMTFMAGDVLRMWR